MISAVSLWKFQIARSNKLVSIVERYFYQSRFKAERVAQKRIFMSSRFTPHVIMSEVSYLADSKVN